MIFNSISIRWPKLIWFFFHFSHQFLTLSRNSVVETEYIKQVVSSREVLQHDEGNQLIDNTEHSERESFTWLKSMRHLRNCELRGRARAPGEEFIGLGAEKMKKNCKKFGWMTKARDECIRHIYCDIYATYCEVDVTIRSNLFPCCNIACIYDEVSRISAKAGGVAKKNHSIATLELDS